MNENNEAINHYYSLKPSEFPILEGLNIFQSLSSYKNGTVELSLEITLRPTSEANPRRLFLSFRGVRNLHLIQPSWSEFQISLLEISFIGDVQWESLKYSVKDPEESSLSFMCRDFVAKVEEL